MKYCKLYIEFLYNGIWRYLASTDKFASCAEAETAYKAACPHLKQPIRAVFYCADRWRV